MGWDNEFFTDSKNVFRNYNEPSGRVGKEGKKVKHCSGCNHPIGTVSIALYEIDEKYYCSECYFRTIVNQAVERDHFDIKCEKKSLNQQTT